MYIAHSSAKGKIFMKCEAGQLWGRCYECDSDAVTTMHTTDGDQYELCADCMDEMERLHRIYIEEMDDRK